MSEQFRKDMRKIAEKIKERKLTNANKTKKKSKESRTENL